MQFFRNVTWWFIGLTTTLLFIVVLVLSDFLKGQFWSVPSSALIVTYLALLLGFINKIGILRLGDTLIHEIGHAQMAALTFGKVTSIRVERDSSGVTFHFRSRFFQRFSTSVVSLFGPISSSVIFLITTRFISSELTAFWSLGAGLFVILILLTTVRNLWGWISGLSILFYLYVILETSGYIDPTILISEKIMASNTLLVNSLLAITAFNCGTALRYSWSCRFARSPNSDEYKFSRSLFLPGFVGGHLIFVVQICLIFIGLGFLLGWPSLFGANRFI